MKKIPLVLFSGGADSASVLQLRLESGPCDVLIADCYVGERKIAGEEQARTKIIEYLYRQESTVGRVLKTYDLRTSLRVPINEHWPLQQMPVWVMAALTVLDPNRHSVVDVGYVLGDCAQGSLDKLAALWDMAVDVFFGPMWDQEKGYFVPLRIPLSFPFRYSKKTGIYQRLGADLFHLTWSCERPVSSKKGQPNPCGICVPCKTRETIVKELGWPFDKSAPPDTSGQDIADPGSPLIKTPKSPRSRPAKKKK